MVKKFASWFAQTYKQKPKNFYLFSERTQNQKSHPSSSSLPHSSSFVKRTDKLSFSFECFFFFYQHRGISPPRIPQTFCLNRRERVSSENGRSIFAFDRVAWLIHQWSRFARSVHPSADSAEGFCPRDPRTVRVTGTRHWTYYVAIHTPVSFKTPSSPPCSSSRAIKGKDTIQHIKEINH